MAANMGHTFPANADGEGQPLRGLLPSQDLHNQKVDQIAAPGESENPEHLDGPEERKHRDEEIAKLARRATERSIFSTVEGDPFARAGDILDPNSGNFSARAWTKAVMRALSQYHVNLGSGT